MRRQVVRSLPERQAQSPVLNERRTSDALSEGQASRAGIRAVRFDRFLLSVSQLESDRRGLSAPMPGQSDNIGRPIA